MIIIFHFLTYFTLYNKFRFIHLTTLTLYVCHISQLLTACAPATNISKDVNGLQWQKICLCCSYRHQRKLCSCSMCLFHYESQAKGATLSKTCCCHGIRKAEWQNHTKAFQTLLRSDTSIHITLTKANHKASLTSIEQGNISPLPSGWDI